MHTNYVISLTTATQRREHIKKEFGRHNISFEFYDALVPSEYLNQLIQMHLPNLAQAKLSEGEKACFMSHYMLWKKCIDENLPYIYIFEDDVLLGEDAHLFLEEDKWLDERFNLNDKFVLRFETFLKPAKCEDIKIISYKSREILKLLGEQYGLASYVISYKAIKELCLLISNLPSKKLDAIDILVFRDFLNTSNVISYQLIPAIVVQELQWNKNKSLLYSQLEDERFKLLKHQNREKKPIKRTLKEKIIRAINKPKRLIDKRKQKKYIILFK
ncbi:lipooligosaccharide biosynthesis protein lic2B [Rodentibacter genomosp. 2]|uniref:glycosyltransferase family 25 protein n=1 Tax=Rodentibacter genomosp. 2 TaxID=1908266 RepID=UPI0009872769|nr:lipooligosaccharide biosynthesis protein lic2B [Rodentibacter genomosp. 2]